MPGTNIDDQVLPEHLLDVVVDQPEAQRDRWVLTGLHLRAPTESHLGPHAVSLADWGQRLQLGWEFQLYFVHFRVIVFTVRGILPVIDGLVDARA